MTDRQLMYIVKIAEEKNLTSAARRLYISQPSLSNLLSHVEQELGVKLFDRDANPIKPTYAGECYLSAANKILGAQRELHEQLDAFLQEEQGKLIIGCGPRLSPILIPQILPTYMKENPGIQIQLAENDLRSLVELLETGNLDLIFSNRIINNPNLGSVVLFREEFMLCTPREYLQEQKENANTIDLHDFEECPFVFMKTNSIRSTIENMFKKCGFVPNMILESTSWEVCSAMVSSGLACTILPIQEHSGKQVSENMDYYHISDTCFRDTLIFYRKNYSSPKVIQGFLSHCQDVFQGNL